MVEKYVHGYGPDEMQRMLDQASILVELLHADTVYPAGAKVLEAGCGVGAQTVTLASHNPARAGGDALIGRRLYPMLRNSGLSFVHVSPRLVYADGSRPAMADAFTRKTFAAMIEGIRAQAIAAGLISAADFERGIAGLHRAAEPDGVFCYTFFKATAVNA
jgi:hypothetical protein